MYTENQIKCSLLISSELSLTKLSEDLCEQSHPTDEKTQKTWLTISEALAATIKQALQQNRVSTGVIDCAKLLGCSPNRVMMCVLPEITDDDNVSVHIHHTLIKSFCWENNIRLLMVKDQQRLFDLIRDSPDMSETTLESASSCVLIENPTDGNSEADTFVCGYHDAVMYSDILPKPVIQLPE